MSVWTHVYRSQRGCPTARYGRNAQIKVKAGLHKLDGNARPYFSVTGEIFVPGRRDCEACGCMHEVILKYWPELAPVVALHLSDDRGTPMHAEANGWYWLAGYYGGADERYHGGNSKGHYGGQYREPTPSECLENFADHVRIPIEQAKECAIAWENYDDWKSSRRWFGQWLAKQADRWQREANAACVLLDELAARRAEQLAKRAERAVCGS